MAFVVYTYLRIIVDHGTPTLANLRQKEVELCVSLLRAHVSKLLVWFWR